MPIRVPGAWRGNIEDWGRSLTVRSPEDMLNGEWLAEVFRKFFGSEPGYTTVETDVGGSSTDGPFIRFAEAVFEETVCRPARDRP